MNAVSAIRSVIRILAAPLAALLLALYVYALFQTDPGQGLIAKVEHYRDPTAELGLSQVFTRQFEPAGSNFRGSYDTAANWYRIGLTPHYDEGDILLEVSPPSLNSVTLYLPGDAPHSWQALHSGNHVPLTQRQSRRLPISFLIPGNKTDRTVYIRVQSATSTSLTLSADRPEQADMKLARLMALHVIYFALLVMGLLLASLRFAEDRSRLSLSLCAFLSVYLAYSISALGYGVLVLDDPVYRFHDRVTLFSALATVLTSMIFQRCYLGRHRPALWAMKLTDLVILLQLSMFIPLAIGDVAFAGYGTVICALAFLPLLVALLATGRIDSPAIRRSLFPAYAIYIAVSALWMLARVGLFATLSDTRHFIEVFGLNNLFLALILIILDRHQVLSENRARLLSVAVTSSEQGAHARNVEVQDSFMHMLVHEVRNHLAVLQLSLPDLRDPTRKAAIGAAISDLERDLTKAQRMIWLARGTWPARPEAVLVLEPLDRVIETLGLADRILLHGDATDAAVFADVQMLEAMLDHALRFVRSTVDESRPMVVAIAQPAPNLPCVIEISGAEPPGQRLGHDAPDNEDLDLAKRLAASISGQVELHPRQAGTVGLKILLPPHAAPATKPSVTPHMNRI